MNPLFPLLAASVSTAPLALQPAEAGGKRKELVKVSLIAHDTAVKPGDTLQVGVVLDIARHWHVYWPGQSDSGTPTTVELSFSGSPGLTAGAAAFPVPARHVLPGDILDYVHEGKLIITVPVNVPATAKAGESVKINAKVNYLVCNEACQPGDADVSTTVAIGDKSQPNQAAARLIDDARAAQPRPQAEGFDAAATAKWEVGHASDAEKPTTPRTLVIEAKEAGVTEMTFYPADGAAKLRNALKTGHVKGRTLRLTFDPGQKPVEGVVELKTGNTGKAWSFRMDAPKPHGEGAPARPAAPAPASPAR